MVFIDKWSLFGGYFINEGLLECGLYLQDRLYLEVVFNTGLTVLHVHDIVVIILDRNHEQIILIFVIFMYMYIISTYSLILVLVFRLPVYS